MLFRNQRDPTKSLPAFFAAALLTLFAWMASSVSREHSTTADEIFHVSGGYSYWKHGDFRLQPENGNFPQRWAALPLLLQGHCFPALDQNAWRTADVAEIGHQFFYELGNDLAQMLASARMMVALLGAACGAMVFVWSRSLFGYQGALVSVALYAFCPHLLAHGGLATSDIAACLGFLAAVLTSWRLLHRVTLLRIVLCGAAAGLLFISKFSAPLLVPVIALMALVRLFHRVALPVHLGNYATRLHGWRSASALLSAFIVAALIAWTVLWSAYDFRYAGLRGAGKFNRSWAEVLMDRSVDDAGAAATEKARSAASGFRPGIVQTIVRAFRAARMLPEAWLYGLAHVDAHSRWRPAFFFGEYRPTGWWSFFPVAFLLKTPLPVLVMLPTAMIVLWHLPSPTRRRRFFYRLIPLAAFGSVYAAFALTTRLNIGHRHILPLYPVLYILAGSVAIGFGRRGLVFATGALLLWHAGSSVVARPHYLAYFNPLLGGSERAYQHFVDSSLDWGQDLPGLKRWLDAHAPSEKIYLSYFGSGSPKHEGIAATRLADGNFDLRGRIVAPAMTGGVYCISATMFQQVYTFVRHGWNTAHEERYRTLRAWAEGPPAVEPVSRSIMIRQLIELEHLRFGRLCAALRDRPPNDHIGFSILIYRLSDAEVNRALEGPAPYSP